MGQGQKLIELRMGGYENLLARIIINFWPKTVFLAQRCIIFGKLWKSRLGVGYGLREYIVLKLNENVMVSLCGGGYVWYSKVWKSFYNQK